jgi:DNA-binding NtrC family response regulator
VNDRSAVLVRRAFASKSPRIRELLESVVRILDLDANVLLLGESGTGKDFLAELVHRTGRRSGGPFLKIDCANLPPDLFESELFGYEKGAFTDAHDRKTGKIELAQGGTLYFDEVGGLDLHLQAKLLRVFQERRITRLGGNASITLDARIIASSNVDLFEAVRAGTFRSDLYYRLNVMSLTLPPLRERREDIPILARRFLRRAAERYRRPAEDFSAESHSILRSYTWPGNVRELRNIAERAAILSTEPLAGPETLPTERFLSPRDILELAVAERWSLERLEAAYIAEVLRVTRNNRSRAADLLGINRKTLLEKRRKYGLP